MHIRLFIVTYQGYERLNTALGSLFDSNLDPIELEVYIINNHTEFKLKSTYEHKVNVLHNNLRPDWSNGHLSRNWNQALMFGFEDLSDPACDAVVAVQDDTDFHPEWATRLIKLHEKYSLVQNGLGDQFVSYRPEAVKKIGLWDERFIFSHHSADYFRRAVRYNRDGTTINDPGHGRVYKQIFSESSEKSANFLIDADPRKIDDHWGQSTLSMNIGEDLMRRKYGDSFDDFDKFKHEPKMNPDSEMPMLYPYFEKEIHSPASKGYVYDEAWETSSGNSHLDRLAASNTLIQTLEKLGVKKEAKKFYKTVSGVFEDSK